MSAIKRVCQFNGIDLSTVPYLTVVAIDNYGPDRTLNITSLARRNARKLSSSFYQKRTVYVSVVISAPSRAIAEKSIDSLTTIIQPEEGSLVVEQSGTVRQYTCTYSKLAKNNTGVGRGNAAPPKGGYADFTLEFETSDSYGYDTNYTLITNQPGLQSGNVVTPYTQNGSALWQVPFIQVQITAVSGGNGASVIVGNNSNGQAISVNRNWSVGDLLQIDCRNKTVQVNGQDVLFTGAFPEFQNSTVGGLQTLTYNDTFTTRTFNFFAYVYNRWN